jgi:hypothetical protein
MNAEKKISSVEVPMICRFVVLLQPRARQNVLSNTAFEAFLQRN